MQRLFFSHITTEAGTSNGDQLVAPTDSKGALSQLLTNNLYGTYGWAINRWTSNDKERAIVLSRRKDFNGKRFFWVTMWEHVAHETHGDCWRLLDGWCFNNYHNRAADHYKTLVEEAQHG